MAQDTYNHISFEDDEEEVFVVGAAAAAPAPTALRNKVSAVAETYEDAKEIADEVAAFYDVAAEGDFGVPVADSNSDADTRAAAGASACAPRDALGTEAGEAAATSAAKRQKKQRNSEHEQTAEDLLGEPMPLLQKIIIAAAVMGVAVLVAYLILV